MTFGSIFGRVFSPTFQPHSISGGKWWLAGGINPANCIAAYQPKGAASYAASKVNLANPGTYDATEGVAPDWAVTTGWTFNGSNDYLKTGVTPTRDQTWSMAISYSGETNWNTADWECLVGSFSTSGGKSGFLLSGQNKSRDGKQSVWSGTGTILDRDNLLPSSGVFALAGKQVYLDGTPTLTVSNGSTTGNHLELYIGGLNFDGSLAQKVSGNILAVSIYNATLTSTQISNLTTAMNAL